MGFIMVFILFFLFSIFIFFMQQSGHEDKINRQILALGGRVVSIEKMGFFDGLGPFIVVGKGRTVYRIEYQVGDEVKEGWVRFGGIMGPDWRL